MANPKISVIIPTFNRADLVIRAVDSVLNQTYRDFEIIVVDDGSSDNTAVVLKNYIERGQIKYLYQKNQGAAVARNLGIGSSRGKFLAFLDSDDEWLPQKLEEQIKIFDLSQDPLLGVVYCNIAIVDKDGRQTDEAKAVNRGSVLKNFLEYNIVCSGSNALVKTAVFSKCGLFDDDKNLCQGDDWEMWIRASKSFNFDCTPKVLAKQFWGYGGNMSMNTVFLKRVQSYEYIINKYLDDYKANPKIYSTHLVFIGSLCCQGGDLAKGRSLFKKAIGQSIFNVRAYLYFLISLLGVGFYRDIARLTFSLRTARDKKYLLKKGFDWF